MKLVPTPLQDAFIIEPSVYEDDRGYFYEAFNHHAFIDASGIEMEIVQINRSLSHKNVLRGFHFQEKPFEQAKIISVAQGAVYDVVVDLRETPNNSVNGSAWN